MLSHMSPTNSQMNRHVSPPEPSLLVECPPTPFYRMNSLMIELERQNKELRREREQLRRDLAEMVLRQEAQRHELVAFNRTVAHDLRQPLNIIHSYSQALTMCCDDLDDTGRSHVQGIMKGVLRMDRLIGAFNRFSRVGVVEPCRQKVDISAMAHGEITRLAQREPSRQVEVRIADGIMAYADYELMAKVMENLLGNAWKYTSITKDPAIEVSATESSEGTVYQVRDNGVGFEEMDLDKLFVPFQGGLGDAKLRGFGMGLPTVARIISRHGGRIWAEGAPGEGATIRFTCGS
jgi:light-regulated signal transduction histidine kinase (bacteriophytochrome)